MMAAILKSAILDSDTAILDSDTLLSSLRFTQKHSHSTLTLIQTNSIWLMWWWQPSWILPSWIQPFCNSDSKLIHSQTNSIWLKLIHSHSTWWCLEICHLEFCHLGFNHFEQEKTLTHSLSLNLMMAAILNSTILDSAIFTKKLHSFILTQLDDGSHLEFCHVGFSHHLDSDTLLSSFRYTQKHSHSSLTLTQTNSIWLKLILSYLTWLCQPSWNLPSWIQPFWAK